MGAEGIPGEARPKARKDRCQRNRWAHAASASMSAPAGSRACWSARTDGRRLGGARVSPAHAEAGLDRAGAGRLVARDDRGGPRAGRRGPGRPVAAIGLTGQMHGSVFLDGDGRPIRPALLWNDQRTAAECAEIETRVGRSRPARSRRQPGADRLPGAEDPLAAGQRARGLRACASGAAAEGLCALRADRRLRDRRLGRRRHAAARPERHGTGRPTSSARWTIPSDWLPGCSRVPTSPAISRRGRPALGLPAGIPVVGGGGDNAAAAVGSGVIRDGTGFVSLGTSGVVFVHSDAAADRPGRRAARLLPRRAGRLPPDGGRALGRRRAAWYRDAVAGSGAL